MAARRESEDGGRGDGETGDGDGETEDGETEDGDGGRGDGGQVPLTMGRTRLNWGWRDSRIHS